VLDPRVAHVPTLELEPAPGAGRAGLGAQLRSKRRLRKLQRARLTSVAGPPPGAPPSVRDVPVRMPRPAACASFSHNSCTRSSIQCVLDHHLPHRFAALHDPLAHLRRDLVRTNPRPTHRYFYLFNELTHPRSNLYCSANMGSSVNDEIGTSDERMPVCLSCSRRQCRAVTVPPNSPDQFARFIAENIDKWTKVIKFAGIKPE
jgi:hypothetical protein